MEMAWSFPIYLIIDSDNVLFRFLDKPRYHNLLLSAWEQKYHGLTREAGRTVLEELCLTKHHLKVPANVYVKKTPSGQQAIDISCLEAPAAKPSEDGETESSRGSQASLLCQNTERKINGTGEQETIFLETAAS